MINAQLFPIRFDNFKVPGKEMLNVPDWRKIYPDDGNGMTNWALRSLLVRDGNKLILIDSGFGNKQTEVFFSQYHLNGNFQLTSQLVEMGLTTNDITDVILTHLHFDHCGGCLIKHQDEIVPAFPKATLWIGKLQWDNALNPEPRERDSFLTENIMPLKDHYDIQFISEEGSWLPGIDFHFANGHTKGQLILVIHRGKNMILFGADLFPSSAHLDPGVNMNYDVNSLLATCEKSDMLEYCLDHKVTIVFQHGLFVECCTLKSVRNKIIPDRTFTIQQIH